MSLHPLVGPGPGLSPAELRRYARHLALPGIGSLGQRRLKQARVLCVGAGGLGSPALMYLAAAGVGTLGIVEFDTVDESNLQRQVIHGQSDLGRPKVDSATDRIREINPLVRVVAHPEALDQENALDLIGGYDLVVDGSDNFATRYLVNDAAVLSGKPYVWGSVYQFAGQAAVFWAGHGPCYRCLYPEPPAADSLPPCSQSGVFGAVCATIAAIQATEVIKLVTGVGRSLLGSLVTYDALTATQRTLTLARNPDCPICGPNPTITRLEQLTVTCPVPGVESSGVRDSGAQDSGETIEVEQLRDWLAADRPMFLVDVREDWEWETARIPGATLIPLGEITSGAALGRFPRELPIVIHCRSGIRSAKALSTLRQAGFSDVAHVAGGILAWAQRIDPNLSVD